MCSTLAAHPYETLTVALLNLELEVLLLPAATRLQR